jgi:uncharacterized protein (TIGR02996 family)
MTVLEALLGDIADNPDDNMPRLVLADWLMEQPDPVLAARGEFMRLQQLLDRLPWNDPGRVELKRRERRLQEQHEKAWLGPLVRVADDWAFRRGLVWLDVAGWDLERLADEAQTQAFRWVDGLAVRGGQPATIRRLAVQPYLAGLVNLDLAHCRLGDEGARALAGSPHLARLASLNLDRNAIGTDGAHALAASSRLPRLTTLSLRGNDDIAEPARAALRARFGEHVHF